MIIVHIKKNVDNVKYLLNLHDALKASHFIVHDFLNILILIFI